MCVSTLSQQAGDFLTRIAGLFYYFNVEDSELIALLARCEHLQKRSDEICRQSNQQLKNLTMIMAMSDDALRRAGEITANSGNADSTTTPQDQR
jgi:hypothetical protein